jgi:hypothetical protein
MLQELNFKSSDKYSMIIDFIYESFPSRAVILIKNLYQNLNIGCKCQYKNKIEVLSSRVALYFNEECLPEHKDLIKKHFSTSKINIYHFNRPDELICSF